MASSRPLLPCLAFILVLFITFSEAREFLVGGRENSWKIPTSPDDLNKWSGKIRFLIGDAIELKYDPKDDSVLLVSGEDYKICNRGNPIRAYNDGDTKVALDRSGPFYFISGAEGHCEKGQKIVVRVLSSKHGSRDHTPAISPAPAPNMVELLAPAPAPTGDGHSLKGGAVRVAVVLGALAGLALV